MLKTEIMGFHLQEIFRESKGWPKKSEIKKSAARNRYDLTCLEIAMQDYANGCFESSPYRSPYCDLSEDMCSLKKQRRHDRQSKNKSSSVVQFQATARRSRYGFSSAGSFKMSTVMAEQDCTCPCCGIDLIAHGNYHLDHIMPLALGGTNDYWNAQFLCAECNLGKSAENPYIWAERTGAKLPKKFTQRIA